jgi:tetratricopeptide (TPR) repeat protein
MEERPDSALAVLQSIEIGDLSSKEEKGKRALLLSIALDKNEIRQTDFEILDPAIDYYKEDGSSTEQMLTLFYQGQIHRINSQYAQALTCFCDAIKISDAPSNIHTIARVYDAQGDVYKSLAKWNETIKSKLFAADCFSKLDNTDYCVSALLDVFYSYTQEGDFINAEKYLNECYDHIKDISSKTLSKYYSYYLN